MGSEDQPNGEGSPGLTLQQWLELAGMSYSAFSRLLPVSTRYPRMIARGLARPSYELACRIEQVTEGQVLRTQWYPAPPPQDNKQSEDDELC